MKNIQIFEEFISSLHEKSDITPERMLLSVYDVVKQRKGIKVGKINNDSFDFSIDTKQYIGGNNIILTDVIEGAVESREGKILISFYSVKVNPIQYDLIYDGDTTLTKDHTRGKVNDIIRQFALKFRK